MLDVEAIRWRRQGPGTRVGVPVRELRLNAERAKVCLCCGVPVSVPVRAIAQRKHLSFRLFPGIHTIFLRYALPL